MSPIGLLTSSHDIAGFPELADLSPRDVAMDTFRMFFALHPTSAKEWKDGAMAYRLLFSMNSEHYLQMARFIILSKELPLHAKLDQFAIGRVVFETHLVISYEEM